MVKRMKMKKYIQSMMAFAAIVSFASCSSEDNNTTIENESATKVMTFTATQEGDEQSTRAAISSTESKVINWQEGDQISIFDGKTNNQFTLKNGAGTKSATFQGNAATAAKYTAVYPYQSEASYDTSNGKVTGITLKATQNATANSFDKEAALMIAEGDNTTLTFKNVVGYVKVKPTFNCTRIDLKAFDNSAVLAGTGTVSYNNGKPTLDLSETKDYAITLRGDIKANKYYYIAVPPVTLKAGWTIQFTASDGKVYSRKGTKPITFTRNKVTNLGEFATTGDYPARGDIVRADQEVDMGVFEINGINYRLIFAKSNLTKDGLAANEYDYGDYFAWRATSVWYSAINQNTNPWSITPLGDKPGGYKAANAPYYYNGKYTSGNTLEAADDAARQILKGDWQIPTKEIWMALEYANHRQVYWGPEGKWTFDQRNGINGISIVRNDRSNQLLFLPAAGHVSRTEFKEVGSIGDYWSGTAYTNDRAYNLQCKDKNVTHNYNHYHSIGLPVRPVRLVAVD